MSPSLETLHEQLAARLPAERLAWLDETERRVADAPDDLAVVLPGVGRRTGRGPLLDGQDLASPHTWTVDDAARVRLVVAAGPSVDLGELYAGGDPGERRGVLLALAYLAEPAAGPALVDDAIRTNDPRLIAAALGPYAARTLDDASYAQAVLKCVFVGIPLTPLPGLGGRVTPELARMLVSYAHERVAASRPIATDVWPLVARFPPEAELAELAAEQQHLEPSRRAAAEAAWADHLAADPIPDPETE